MIICLTLIINKIQPIFLKIFQQKHIINLSTKSVNYLELLDLIMKYINLINNNKMRYTAYLKSTKNRIENEKSQSNILLKILTLSSPFILFPKLSLDQTLLYVSIIVSGV